MLHIPQSSWCKLL